MAYEVEFTKRTAAYIKRLDTVTKRRVHQSITELAEQDLESSNLKRLQGDSFFRKRLGDLRILFRNRCRAESTIDCRHWPPWRHLQKSITSLDFIFQPIPYTTVIGVSLTDYNGKIYLYSKEGVQLCGEFRFGKITT